MNINYLLNLKTCGKNFILCSLVTAAATHSASAAVSINANMASVYSVSSITEFATTGAMMTGMKVSVTYFDGTVKSATWATTGLVAGNAKVVDFFTLAVAGDTFSSLWYLTNHSASAITAFHLYGLPGKTAFDLAHSENALSTPGSASGQSFAFGTGGTSTVNYSSAVKLNSHATPVGDLFLRMEVVLDADSFVAPGQVMSFLQDTDNFSAIPEPSAGIVTALLIGFGLTMRRRNA